MEKTRQIMKLADNGRKFSVVYKESEKYNKYVIYRHTWNGATHTERKRIEVKYSDLRSCLLYLANAV